MENDIWRVRYRELLGNEKFGYLEKFIGVSESIQKRRYFQKARNLSPTITIRKTAEGTITTATDYDHGDIEELRSAILSVRPLLLDKDPTYINRIVGLLVKYEDEQDRVDFIKELQRKTREQRRQMAFYVIPPDLHLPVPINENGIPSKWEKGRTYEQLLNATLYRALFHWGESDGKPKPPNLNIPDFSGDTILEIVQRGMLIAALYIEAEFACRLSEFVKGKGR